jgi:hypothetical protein
MDVEVIVKRSARLHGVVLAIFTIYATLLRLSGHRVLSTPPISTT